MNFCPLFTSSCFSRDSTMPRQNCFARGREKWRPKKSPAVRKFFECLISPISRAATKVRRIHFSPAEKYTKTISRECVKSLSRPDLMRLFIACGEVLINRNYRGRGGDFPLFARKSLGFSAINHRRRDVAFYARLNVPPD